MTTMIDQKASELRTIEKGRENYEKRTQRKVLREGFDKHDEVQKIIRGAVPILATGIAGWVEQASQAKGRKATGLPALSEIAPDVLAYLGVVQIFRALGRGGRVTEIVTSVGRKVEIELEAMALSAKDPKVAKKFLKFAKEASSERVLELRLERLLEREEIDMGWDDTVRALVGQSILNIALVTLQDLIVTKTIVEHGHRHAVVELTQEAAEALMEMEDHAFMSRLPLEPMIEKPRTWEGLYTGAYHDYRLSRLVPLVRTRSKEHKQLLKDAVADGSMAEVLVAVNAIQDTRWAIDTRILDLITWTSQAALRPSSSFPSPTLPEKPAKVEKEAWDVMSREEKAARSRQRKSIQQMRLAIGTDRENFNTDMDVANRLADCEAFWLPHSLDFRGRTYAVPYFNHQRSDHLKALFCFADAVELGEHGGEELMVHLANCGDFNKVSKATFTDRIAWVRENEGMILLVARFPTETYDLWSKADSPFCFVQACMEYAAWMESGFSPSYRSCVPGAADGSCSGLQHYSAITRSADEAHHVNLTPREDVGDIYNVVAGQATPSLQLSASNGDEAAQVILANGFGRSEVKRNVMTYFYGSERYGMRDQHMKDLMQPLSDKVAMGEIEKHPYAMQTERVDKETGEVTLAWDGGYTCANTMAAHVYHAVTTVAQKADEAAQWIRTVASVLAHESQSMVWRTQTGFPVVQRYSEFTSKRVNLWLYDRTLMVPTGTDKVDQEGNVLSRVQVLLREAPTKRVDKKTMRNASSPNVIHSMDAAHLHRAVSMAKAEGIEHFSMIHDSFGTHFGNMRKFGRIIREAFVSCYSDYCPLQELDKYARSVLSEEGIEKLPPIPAKGNLVLEDILNSKYAFA